MGCLFSSKNKKELAESEDKAGSPQKQLQEGKKDSNRPNLYLDTEQGPSKSPRPQLPSPYQNVEIDPAKRSQIGSRLNEHGDEIVNEETHVLEGKTFAPALHELNLQVALT